MIIDCHTHVASYRSIPRKFFESWTAQHALGDSVDVSSGAMNVLDQVMNSDPMCDALIAEMNEACIDKAVLLIVDWSFAPGYEFDRLEALYPWYASITARHKGRFIVFGTVEHANAETGAYRFEEAVRDHGIRGLKLYPPCGYSPSDKRWFPYFEVCSQYRIPVLSHVGPSANNLSYRFTSPLEIDDAAWQFPAVNFILAHGAFLRYQEAALLAEYRPNVFLDVSGFQNQLEKGQFDPVLAWHRSNGTLCKLIFGTDWPIHRIGGTQHQWVSVFQNAASRGVISTAELGDIFEETPRRVLGI